MNLILTPKESISILRESSRSGYDATTGDPITGTTSTITAKANIQPVDGRDLQQVPQGEYTKQLLRFYSTTEMIVGDTITRSVQSLTYKILSVESWLHKRIQHYKAIGALIDYQLDG